MIYMSIKELSGELKSQFLCSVYMDICNTLFYLPIKVYTAILAISLPNQNEEH